jgi:hypothetical protein
VTADSAEVTPPSQISVGTAFLYEHEMQITRNFWNLVLNINISNYGEMAQTALRDMEELVRPMGTEPEIQREIGNLQIMAKKLFEKYTRWNEYYQEEHVLKEVCYPWAAE